MATPRFGVRLATQADLETVATPLAEYLERELRGKWLGSVERLGEDGSGARFDLHLALASAGAMGFVAFAPDSDLHICVRGGRVLGLYVKRIFADVRLSDDFVQRPNRPLDPGEHREA